MARRLFLDTGPLGLVTHPRVAESANQKIRALCEHDFDPSVPDVCDYELRRELIRAGKEEGRIRLDQLIKVFGMINVTPDIWRQAAQLWARARNQGRPTADPKALDADVILAAEALAHDAVVLTTDPGDLGALIGADRVITWRDL